MKLRMEGFWLPCCTALLVQTGPVAAANRQVAPPAMPVSYAGLGPAAGGSPAIDQWWHAFNDPALDALEAEALKIAPDARVATERLIEARQTRRRDKAETGPKGSIIGTISRQRNYDLSGGGGAGDESLVVIDSTNDVQSGIANFSYELDILGRQKALRRAAAATELVEQFGSQAALVELTSQLAGDYFEAQGLASRLATATEQARLADERASIAQRRATGGFGSSQDAQRLAGLQGDARAEIERLTAQLAVQKRQILLLIGRGMDPVDSVAIGTRLPALPAPVAAVPSELLTRRPDVRQAEFRLKAALSRARYRHLSVFPSISLLPSLGISHTPFPQVSFADPNTPFTVFQQNRTQGFWLFGINITIPTLDIPRLLAEARAEDSRARQAAINYERAAQVAYRDVQNAIITLDAGRRTADRLIEAQTRAAAVYSAARRLRAAGLADEATWVDAQDNWARIQQNLTNEQVENLRRQAQLFKALGGGWNFTRQPS